MDQALPPEWIARRRRRRALAAIGVAVALAGSAWGLNRAIAPGVALEEIVVAEVRRGGIANTISATGVAIPLKEEQVTSPVATRLLRVHAQAGQPVAAGELLLTLDNRAVALAIEGLREQLAQQENKLAVLSLELEQKRKQIASTMELLALDLKSAEVKWARYQEFRDTGTISRNELLAAELAVQRAEIQLRQQRELLEDSRRTTQSLEAANRLQTAILRKQLDQQLALLAQTEVRAPFAGLLTWVLADEGASVAGGQLVARVSELNNFAIEASLSDLHARALQPGQPVRVEHGGQVLAGRVRTVLPEIVNGTVKLLVALERPDDPVLRPKLRVQVDIVTESRADTLVVDHGPALRGRGRQSVFVLGDGEARRTELEIGASDGRRAEVLSGARAGDRVIVSDLGRFRDRDRLRITP